MIAYQRIIIFLAILHLAQHRCASGANFLLVHGSGHGAWCWYKLATLLQEAGHNVTAIDLTYSGRNLIPHKCVDTIDGYHEPLFFYLNSTLSPEDRVILVGHSFGGFAVSSAMERFPEKIISAVFVDAYMVGPNLTFTQIQERYPLSVKLFNDSITCGGDPPTIVLFGPNYLATTLYQNSPKEDYQLANYSQRVTKYFYDEVSTEQLLVSTEKYGSVPRAYIMGLSDAAIPPDAQRFFIESNPPDVVKEIAGADHMVMFSKPHDLAKNLQEIALNISVLEEAFLQ